MESGRERKRRRRREGRRQKQEREGGREETKNNSLITNARGCLELQFCLIPFARGPDSFKNENVTRCWLNNSALLSVTYKLIQQRNQPDRLGRGPRKDWGHPRAERWAEEGQNDSGRLMALKPHPPFTRRPHAAAPASPGLTVHLLLL